MLLHGFQAALFAQRHRFALWLPVWLGIGIAIYFAIRFEPDINHIFAVFLIVCILVAFAVAMPSGMRVSVWIPIFVSLGFLLAVTRAHTVGAPKISWHYYGSVEGTVAHLDRSSSDKPRVTLIDPVLSKTTPYRTPKIVRVALHSKTSGTALTPGARIMITASLSPPAGPVEPGGFDFQRKAWFQGLGATGYSRTPPMLAVPANSNTFRLRIFALRMWVSKRIQIEIPGQTGAFAAAIITGDRSQIDPALLTDLRQSNLAHLLAISGLHMGLLTGFIFAIVRLSIAAIQPLSVRWHGKKIGAVVALFAGLSYLLLSGANIATQRAFVMVAVMLIAILLDRPAITLRAVAIAATIILVARPKSLTQPGFQMSFAATTALVATFEALNKSEVWRRFNTGALRFGAPVFSLIIASAVAGAATAPFSAFHFNQTAQYGLIANLASVPMMGLIVMPFAVIAGVLSLVGLQGPAFWVMGKGIDWILGVAHWIANLDGAVIRIASAPPWVLGMFTLGALILILYRGRFRLAGIGVAGIALIFWAQADRPAMLITESGRLVGISTDKGRALSRNKGNGFAAKNWLENDGDGASQSYAAKRAVFDKDVWSFDVETEKVTYLWGKKLTNAEITSACGSAKILIAPQYKERVVGPCYAITQQNLRTGGAVAIWKTKDGLKAQTAKEKSGKRLWNE
ncbi:ComEC family competence protein [Amylibacter sp.]|nr:ComEC family competence protein [Amylibacter sp.]